MFRKLVELVEEHGKGTLAFGKASAFAREQAGKSRDTAAAWLLLADLTELFVERNDRMPLQDVYCREWFEMLQSRTAAFDSAFSDGTADDRLRVLNEAAEDLLNRS